MVELHLTKDSATTKGPALMNAKHNRRQHQQKVFQKEASNQDAISFFNVLTSSIGTVKGEGQALRFARIFEISAGVVLRQETRPEFTDFLNCRSSGLFTKI